ncbi:hypothetical protein [Pseudomonas sp. Irchel s3b6]|uniref:hypothetical protein n=1 Tax=Pseudomonas sp. Irchel s3b6 TaxID=2009078 RepID=UPI00211433DC|nr:hypothetical protein [Pseudomonas sp. Irchel s3b6]
MAGIADPASRSSRHVGDSVQSVEPVRSVSALDHSRVDVKRVVDRTQDGRYYDQHYALVDGAGKPVTSGAYLITLAYP